MHTGHRLSRDECSILKPKEKDAMCVNREKASLVILVAVIGAVASIVAALISSGIFADSYVKRSVKTLEITEVDIWETKAPNTRHTSERGGIVVAVANAAPDHRYVPITGYIEDELIAAAAAQDSYREGVPSITSGSFAMPVPKGREWEVKVPESEVGQVQVKWFTIKAQVTAQE